MAMGASSWKPIFSRVLLSVVFLLVAIPSITWSAPLTSKDELSSDDSDVDPAPSANGLDQSNSLEALHKTEVVYAASKSEQQTTEQPGSTTILTSSEIKVGGFRTLDDLLNYVRGFFVDSDHNYTYVGLRGFGSLGGYNSRILLLVDGHRINDNIYGQFYSGEDSPVDMDTVDHVEIIRGPASVLYGNSAVFGVINVITKKGKDIQGLELSTQGGSLNTLGGGVLYGGLSKDGFQWTVQGSAYSSGGNLDLYFPEYNDPSTNNGFAHNVDGENSQHFFLSLDQEDWAFEAAFMHRYKTIPTGVYGTAFNDPQNYTDDVDLFAEARYSHGDPETGQWLGRVSLDMADYWGNYVAADTGIPNVDQGDGAWASSELQYVFTPIPRNKVTLGGEFIDNFMQMQKNYDLGVSPAYLNDWRQSTQWALYAQDEVKLSSTLFLNAGGRYEYFSTTGGQFVPRGALVWEPQPTSVLKVVAGEALRAPDGYELYYQDNGNTQESNPDLDNETFQTYEFDWEQSFLTNHRVLLSLYRYIGQNLILGVPDPNNGLLVYQNIGHISINGLEMEYQFQDTGGIQGRVSWAYQRAQDDITGQVLPDSPQNLGKASLQVPIDAKHLTVAGECQFTGASYGFTGVWAGDYTLFNLKLYSPHFILENMEANLAFYNLFDTRYYQPVANSFQQMTMPQDGLVIWARLGYRL